MDVKTSLGRAQYKVPSNKREVELSPQREEWLEANRKALDAILAAPGNCLVPVTEAEASGVPIARTVSTRRIKIEQAIVELAANEPFKSRHAADGGDLERQRERVGQARTINSTPATATIVDDMTLNP